MKLAILYEVIPHKPINGSLFYCYEYYRFIDNLKQDIIFIIKDTSKKYKNLILNTIENKYLTDSDNIIFTHSIMEIYKLSKSIDKILFLDTRSYRNNFEFLETKNIYLYNNDNNFYRPKTKNLRVYGYYDYQDFDFKTLLKFYFDIYPPLKKSKKGYFLSSTLKNINEKISKKISEKIKGNKIEKNVFQHVNNLFESFDTLVYIHSTLDTNNRIIIESAFYNKNIEFIDEISIIDSSHLRYKDVKNRKLNKYYLTKDDILIKDFINENI